MDTGEIHVGLARDARRYLATDETVWFGERLGYPPEQQLLGLPAEQRFCAEVPDSDPASYPGIYGVFPMRLAVPTGDETVGLVPCAGLTWVGVHPDHRRRGLLTAMLRDHFERTRAAGVSLSVLHASEPAIYGRHGYGLASVELEVVLGRGTELVAPGLEDAAGGVRTCLATNDEPGVAARMRSILWQEARLGDVVGEQGYFERLCWQPPEELRDKEPVRLLFARDGERDVGFAMFERTEKWERNRPNGEVRVGCLVGAPAVRLALLRRLLDLDLIGTVRVSRVGRDDELLHWIAGPRGARDVLTCDCLWLRLVDLPAALRARRYDAEVDTVIRVRDAAAPWNAGRWRLRVASGVAEVEHTDREADLTLDVRALGAAYLGDASLAVMQRAGLVIEHSPGAARGLGEALRTALAPAAALGF